MVFKILPAGAWRETGDDNPVVRHLGSCSKRGTIEDKMACKRLEGLVHVKIILIYDEIEAAFSGIITNDEW